MFLAKRELTVSVACRGCFGWKALNSIKQTEHFFVVSFWCSSFSRSVGKAFGVRNFSVPRNFESKWAAQIKSSAVRPGFFRMLFHFLSFCLSSGQQKRSWSLSQLLITHLTILLEKLDGSTEMLSDFASDSILKEKVWKFQENPKTRYDDSMHFNLIYYSSEI